MLIFKDKLNCVGHSFWKNANTFDGLFFKKCISDLKQSEYEWKDL